MKKLLWVSGLATVSVLMSGVAAAQGVGKVISSTPVMKKVTEPKTICTNGADGKEQCQTKSVTENRTVGYNVVYEYAGHKHTAQLPFQPGPTIELEVMPRALATAAKPTAPAKPQVQVQTQAQVRPQSQPQPQPSYSTKAQPLYSTEAPQTYSSPPPVYASQPAQVVDRYVSEPEYVESVYYPQTYYYPRSYYYPSYYVDPFYPVLGLGLAYSIGRYGHGWRGGYSHHGHHSGHRGR